LVHPKECSSAPVSFPSLRLLSADRSEEEFPVVPANKEERRNHGTPKSTLKD
jgi:hypothetical protein